MDYEIKTNGFNCIKDINNNYFLTPFTKNVLISITIKKTGKIKFTLSQNIKNITIIIKHNNEKIKVYDTINSITLNCTENDTIYIKPHIKDINNYKLEITNILLNDIIQKKNSFIIVTTQWGIKIAESLCNMLIEINYNAIIIYDNISDEMLENNKKNPNEYFIILFSHLVSKMPETNKYIIYQLEQKRQSNFITEDVLKNIKNSLITWDYSNENIAQFDEFYKNKLVLQPISIINKIQEYNLPIKYDLLFFGSSSMRRGKIVRYLSLKKKYNIYSTNNIFGEELYKLIALSRIILNLHVCEDAILEIARLNEILPFNKLIISELPCKEDNVNKEFYQDKVIFCDVVKRKLGNIDNLTKLIDYYLKPENYENYIVNNKKNIDLIYSNSLNHLKINLKLLDKKQKIEPIEIDNQVNLEYNIYKPPISTHLFFE